jgi:hypothetical protein
MLALFGALGIADKRATRIGGTKYLAFRDGMIERLWKVLGALAVLGFIALLLTYCSQAPETDCEWDRSGATCYPTG